MTTVSTFLPARLRAELRLTEIDKVIDEKRPALNEKSYPFVYAHQMLRLVMPSVMPDVEIEVKPGNPSNEAVIELIGKLLGIDPSTVEHDSPEWRAIVWFACELAERQLTSIGIDLRMSERRSLRCKSGLLYKEYW